MCSVTTTAGPTSPAHAADDGQTFDTALRGYERRQVDEFVAAKKKEIGRLTAELGESARQRKLATDHAESVEVELRELRARPAAGGASPEEGFGFRAEKLLRMAEQEASEVRMNAGRESAAILEKARSEAERHRHEGEQTLIARAAVIEEQAAARSAELQEREQQIADQLAAGREQTEQMHAAAVRAADRLRQESEAAAEETRVRAETAAARLRDQAQQEIERLTAMQSSVRHELGRLAQVLAAELGERPAGAPAAPPPDANSGSNGRSRRHGG
jgi:cell division septum initiation protein DivIVA